MMGDELRTGDVVRHKPSGETWIVARIDGDDLYPAGWPPTMALVADCVLVSPAIDEYHDALLADLMTLPTSDPRRPRE